MFVPPIFWNRIARTSCWQPRSAFARNAWEFFASRYTRVWRDSSQKKFGYITGGIEHSGCSLSHRNSDVVAHFAAPDEKAAF